MISLRSKTGWNAEGQLRGIEHYWKAGRPPPVDFMARRFGHRGKDIGAFAYPVWLWLFAWVLGDPTTLAGTDLLIPATSTPNRFLAVSVLVAVAIIVGFYFKNFDKLTRLLTNPSRTRWVTSASVTWCGIPWYR